MKKLLIAFALLAVTIVSSQAANPLATIYVGAGVTDRGTHGSATTFHCANVSGVPATVRFLVLAQGLVLANETVTIAHGGLVTASTEATGAFSENLILDTGFMNQGVVNIESTQTAVFCTAMIVDPEPAKAIGIALHLVRVNPHPGTVE